MERSESINELAAALSKAQASYTGVQKQKQAKVKSQRTGAEFTYNYADLADVLQMAIPCLSAQGISFSQPHVLMNDGKLRVCTLLMHSSGQWIRSDGIEISEEGDPQQFGAESTYFRRYDGCSLIGVAPDEDTDAQQAGQRQRRVTGSEALRGKPNPATASSSAAGSVVNATEPVEPVSHAQNEATGEAVVEAPQAMMDKARELHTLADVNNGGVDKDELQAFLKRIGYKPEFENGKPVNSWLAAVRQGKYQSLKAWITENKKAA